MIPALAGLLGAITIAALAGHRPPWPFHLLPQGLGEPDPGLVLMTWAGHAGALAAVAAWIVALGGWGGPLLRWAGPVRVGSPLRGHLARAAGFSALGIAILATGWCGLLGAAPLALVVGLPLAVFRRLPPLRRPVVDRADLPWLALAAIPVLAALPAMLGPEVSWDAMVYHAQLPKTWLIERRHFAMPESPFTGYPCLMEAHVTLALALARTDAVAKLMHAALWLMTARVIQLAAGGGHPGRLAAIAWLGGAAGGLLAGMTYVEFAVAWPVALLAALGTRSAAASRALIMGLLAGTAFLSKYTGGFALVGAIALVAGPGFRRAAWPLAAGFGVPAAVWLVRNALALGNPVYPFATGWLGGISSATLEYWTAHPPAPAGGDAIAFPLARFWTASVREELGVGAPLGPAWLVLFLVAAGAGVLDRRWRLFAGAVACWLALPLDGRFLLPLIPAALVAAAGAATRPGLRQVLTATVAVLTVQGAVDSLRSAAIQVDPVPSALGTRGKAEYLRLGVPPQPEYWDGAEACNAKLPARARLLFVAGIKSYHYERRSHVEHQHLDPCPPARALRLAGTADRLAIRLRQAGTTHLVYQPRVAVRMPGAIPDFSPAAAQVWIEWCRRYTAFAFRAGETLVYELHPRREPRKLGRVPILEEFAMREATEPGRPGWVIGLLARLAPESTTYNATAGLKALMGPPPDAVRGARWLQAAVRHSEASPAAWRAYGYAMAEQGVWDRALGAYREALALLSTDSQAHFGAGLVLARIGRMAEAREAFVDAIRLDPGSPELRQALAQLDARR